MNKASKKSYKDGSLKIVDRRIFNGMSRMWEKFLRYALFFGNLNIVVLGIVLILSVAQFVLFFATRKHSLIHDLLADTVAVDMASQMIFNTTDELVAYKAKLQAEKVAHQTY